MEEGGRAQNSRWWKGKERKKVMSEGGETEAGREEICLRERECKSIVQDRGGGGLELRDGFVMVVFLGFLCLCLWMRW